MRRLTIITAVLLYAAQASGQAPDVYQEQVTSAGNIAATISNLGIIGNGFSGSFNVQGFPSCEYPARSGIEHIHQGGLWIGGLVNGQVAVSTSTPSDDNAGYSPGKAGYEYISKAGITERSSLYDSPFFNPDAISHQDFVSTFTDTSTIHFNGFSSTPINQHTIPMGLKIEFNSYNWNYPFANFFIVLSYRITNISTTPVDSVFVGFWADGVVRSVKVTPPGGTPFYDKGGNGFIDSLNMGYEFDSNGDIGYTDSYIAIKYLGAELNNNCIASPGYRVHYNTWQFRNTGDPIFFNPSTDFQRYNKMTEGLNTLPTWPSIQTQLSSPNNRSNLISAGPFPRLNPGEYIDVAFAIVCARRVFDGLPAAANTPAQRANLIQNAGWAQTAYDGEDANGNCLLDPGEDRDRNGRITRFILPAPPDIPKMRVVAADQRIEVYWADNSEASVDPISKQADFQGYRLYKTAIGFDVQNTQDILGALKLAGQWDLPGDGNSFDTGFEGIRLAQPKRFEGDTVAYRYRYVFENTANGWQHAVALTAYDSGDEVNNLPPLESAPLAALRRVFPGKPANTGYASGDPFVYPNPYYARADWEGASRFEEDRKLIFANLPARCEVRIYTLAGDLVDVFEHDEAYTGSDIRWFGTYADPASSEFSGGEHAWDLLSADTQILARGLYLFAVTDRDSGEKKLGKFVVIK